MFFYACFFLAVLTISSLDLDPLTSVTIVFPVIISNSIISLYWFDFAFNIRDFILC